MKQLKSLFILASLLLVCVDASAYDFEAVNAGQTIYYNKIGGNRLEVTYNGSDSYPGDVVVPDSVEYEGKKYVVTRIGMQAFYSSSFLKNISLPETIDSIAPYAFCMSGITSFVYPSKVKYVTACSFHTCQSLKSVTFHNDILAIEGMSFYNCFNLTELTVPDKVVEIGLQAFMRCNGLKKVTIGKSVETVGENAFGGCSNVEELIFNDGIEAIPNLGLVPTSITKIDVPKSVKSIEDRAFMNFVNLTEVDLPNLERIGDHAFASSGLTSFTFAKNIKSVGPSAFAACKGIGEISLPKTIDYIGESAFAYMSGLYKVEAYWRTPLEIPSNTFSYVSSDAVLSVPYGTSAAYGAALGWDVFDNIEERPFIPVDSIAINQGDTILDLGHTMRLFVTKIFPSNASDPDYEWTCSADSVASLGKDSVVTTHKVGLAVFTAKAKYNPDSITVVATCSLTVKFDPVEELVLNKTSRTVVLGDTVHLFVDKVLPLNASNTDYEWSCSADSIAELGADSVVTTKALGEVTFTATAKDGSGITASCTLTVGNYNLIVTRTNGEEPEKSLLQPGDNVTLNDSICSLKTIRDIEDVSVTYQRKFLHTGWTPWYMPVTFTATDSLLDHFDFAKLAGTYTDENTGDLYISITSVKSTDPINANTPYFVKAKAADSDNYQQLILTNATLKETAERTLRISTAEKNVDITGTYQPKTAVVDDEFYAFKDGKYHKASAGVTLKAFRFFFVVTDREDNWYGSPDPTEIKIKYVGDDATAIETVEAKSEGNRIFDLSGREVTNPKKGIFIVNGKKVYVK